MEYKSLSPSKLIIYDNDIIDTESPSHPPVNLDLFYEFLKNVEKGNADIIRIIQYTFEEIPIIKYLFYDGDNIILVSDTRYDLYGTGEINKYEGKRIVKRDRNSFISYELVTPTSEVPVFSTLKTFVSDHRLKINKTSFNQFTDKITENSLKEELEAVPIHYDMKTAIRNNDIVVSNGQIANERRFEQFLKNLEKGIQDKVRITEYGIDGPPSVSMLGYDGRIIMHIVDVSNFQKPKQLKIYYGACIFGNLIFNNDDLWNTFAFTAPDERHEVLAYSVRKRGRLYCPDSSVII